MAWNAICDRCGFKFRDAQIKKEWTGAMVCRGPGTNDCWEPRHPQEFVRGVPDKQTPPWTRPEGTDVFTQSYYRREDGTVLYREGGVPYLRE